MASFSTFPATITFAGWWYDNFGRLYEKTSSTSTFIQYELYDANGVVGAPYGSQFTADSTGIFLNVEGSGDSGDTPFSFSKNGTFIGASGYVSVGDTITLWASTTGTGTAEATFTVPDFGYSSGQSGGGSGSGTLSVVTTGFTYQVPAGVSPVDEPGRELFLNIAASENTDSYRIYMDGAYHATVSHTNGTVSSGQVTNTGTEYVLYEGTVSTSSSLNIIAATFTNRKSKVSCNFW